MGSCPRVRCWTLIVSLACAHVAFADDLDDARTAVDGSDYMAARAALDKALNAGTASPQELAEIYKLSGIVEGALGNAGPATDAFARWLEIDPKGVLPSGTSPKIAKPYKAAADQAKKTTLVVEAHTVAAPASVTLAVSNDAAKLIVRARVLLVADGGKEQTREGAPGEAIALPGGKRLDLRVLALDEHGNRVYEVGSKAVPLVITGAQGKVEKVDQDDLHKLVQHPRAEPAAPPRPWYLAHRTWGIATLVGLAVTGFFAYETYSDLDRFAMLNRNSLDYVYADAQDVAASARRNIFITDVAAGVTGAFAITTAILYFTRPHPVETTAVRAVPLRDGAAVVVGGHF